MDTSAGQHLSALVKEMAQGELSLVSEVRDLGPRNPLRSLSLQDQHRLIAALVLYTQLRQAPLVFVASVEQAEKVATQANAVAAQISGVLLQPPCSELLAPIRPSAESLHARLVAFAKLVCDFTERIGKKGHKQKTLLTQLLVLASEFVNLTTGSCNDEHLAEPLQIVSGDPSRQDTSGDAIRKKKHNLINKFPSLYKTAAADARDLAGR